MNPSWLAVKPLHNTVISPTSGDDDNARSTESRPARPIHISALEIPVSYEAVLEVVPKLHTRPPVLPDHEGSFFPPPPASGYDFVFHIGVAGRGSLRMERQGHKLGYQMKDANGKLAPVAHSSPKDFMRRPDVSIMEHMERERLGLDMLETSGDTSIRPARGFGTSYDNFPEEIMTEIDVSRLVQDLRRSGFEVRGTRTSEYRPIHIFCSKYIAAWTRATTSVISSIIVRWPRPNEAQSPTRSEGTLRFCSCTVRL